MALSSFSVISRSGQLSLATVNELVNWNVRHVTFWLSGTCDCYLQKRNVTGRTSDANLRRRLIRHFGLFVDLSKNNWFIFIFFLFFLKKNLIGMSWRIYFDDSTANGFDINYWTIRVLCVRCRRMPWDCRVVKYFASGFNDRHVYRPSCRR